jgi:hypothetical protein
MTAVPGMSTSLAAKPGERLPGGSLLASRVLLDEQSAALAGRIEAAFLAEASWDAATWVLTLPAGYPLLGRPVCRATGCQATCPVTAGVCPDCRRRLPPAGCRRRSCGRSAASCPPWPRRTSAPRLRSSSTPAAAQKTSSRCRWTAWPPTPTVRQCWSMTTTGQTGSVGGCQSRPRPGRRCEPSAFSLNLDIGRERVTGVSLLVRSYTVCRELHS